MQVYGRDRRLLCVLEASHGWIFAIGCGFGVLLTLLWVNLVDYSRPAESIEPTTVPPMQQVD